MRYLPVGGFASKIVGVLSPSARGISLAASVSSWRISTSAGRLVPSFLRWPHSRATEMRSFSRVVGRALLIAALTAGLYGALDVLYGVAYPPEPFDSHPERVTAPAYRTEPYFSRVFLRESFTQPGGHITPDGTTLVFPREFHGRFFNTDRGERTGALYRRTIHPPAQGRPRPRSILLLGGSTIYNSEVPDEWTVASQLAAMLDRAQPGMFEVINAGVTSIDSPQELARLRFELEQGLRPSMVVMYDGVNDIYNGVYQNNPNGVLFKEEQKRSEGQRPASPLPAGDTPTSSQDVIVRAKAWGLGLVQALTPRHIYDAIRAQAVRDAPRTAPAHMQDGRLVQAAVDATRERFVATRRAMHDLGRVYGFRAISILQGHAFRAGGMSLHEDVRQAVALAERRLPLLRQAFDAGYPALQDAVRTLRAEGRESFDRSDLFVNKQDPIFLDFCHVTSGGNARIARMLAELILQPDGVN